MTPPAPALGDSPSRGDSGDETQRLWIRRAMRIGLWVWPSFLLVDAYMCTVLHPEAPLPLFVGYRVAIQGVLLAVYRMACRPDVPLRRIAAAQSGSFLLVSLSIALMGLYLGGTTSPYMHGISIVVLVRAASVSEPWRRSLRTLVPIGLTYPAVMGAAALLAPGVRHAWFDRHTLGVFAAHYVFVLASSVVGTLVAHTVWAARQQLYRARRLGRYRLQAPLGRGAMGEVWLAWDATLHRSVALKILRLGGRTDDDSIRRFEREAHATSRLRVPHTIQVHDFGASDDGIHYIAMEYLPGIDLQTLVTEQGPLPAALVVRLAIQACLSLEEAHEAGIIHRDIKPHNLFLTQVGEDREFLKVLDFGLARVCSPDVDGQLTHVGQLVGTPAYIAPELWQAAPADVRSDIYALGATVYFLLTGRAPFAGDTVDAILATHLADERTPPGAVPGASVPEEVDRIVLRCLARDPAARFPSARALRSALLAVQRGPLAAGEAVPATETSRATLAGGPRSGSAARI